MKSSTFSTLFSFAFSLVVCSSYEQGVVDTKQEPCETTPAREFPDYDSPNCGIQANGNICPNDYCCSRYGYCGLSSAYCGAGCQSGPCEDEDANFNYNYCGSTWEHADFSCLRDCPNGVDSECLGNEKCFADSYSCPRVNISNLPTLSPTVIVTPVPTVGWKGDGHFTLDPTLSPSLSPTTSPTLTPTESPASSADIVTPAPTVGWKGDGHFTLDPTLSPSLSPTLSPSTSPTSSPNESPTKKPTRRPSLTPTLEPTLSPSLSPTLSPTLGPTLSPSLSPTLHPTLSPTLGPTLSPTKSFSPTGFGKLPGGKTYEPTSWHGGWPADDDDWSSTHSKSSKRSSKSGKGSKGSKSSESSGSKSKGSIPDNHWGGSNTGDINKVSSLAESAHFIVSSPASTPSTYCWVVATTIAVAFQAHALN